MENNGGDNTMASNAGASETAGLDGGSFVSVVPTCTAGAKSNTAAGTGGQSEVFHAAETGAYNN